MYEIILKEDKKFYDTYEYCSKNSSGQIITLKLTPELFERGIKYYILFYIGKRKKGFQYLNTTGKDGIKSLIWAKNCIKDFVEKISEQRRFSRYEKHSVIVQWDDNRRRDVYMYGLIPLGFYLGVDCRKKSLIYNIK